MDHQELEKHSLVIVQIREILYVYSKGGSKSSAVQVNLIFL